MLKDIFNQEKTVRTERGGHKKIKAAYTTLDSYEDVEQAVGLKPGTLQKWIEQEERGRKGKWKMTDEPFETVFRLASTLKVSIDSLLDPTSAQMYALHETAHPAIPKKTETEKKSADYMTPQQIADHLGISAKTVVRAIQHEEMPAIHLSRRYLVSVIDAQHWINAHRVKTDKAE